MPSPGEVQGTVNLFGHQTSSALFSPDRLYRYTLTRRWDDGRLVNWIMLNPSTADAYQNDPTVERCERRARNWGYAGIVVTNLFAWRSTDPGVLKDIDDPVGPDNDRWLVETATSAGLIVCGWGNDGALRRRSATVLALLRGFNLTALKVNYTGEPQHPLYLGYELLPKQFMPHL